LRRAISDPEMSRPFELGEPDPCRPRGMGRPWGKGAAGSGGATSPKGSTRSPSAHRPSWAWRVWVFGNRPLGLCPASAAGAMRKRSAMAVLKKPSTCRQYCRRPALLRRRIGISWRFFCGIVLLTWLLQNLNLTDRIYFNPRLSIRFGPSFARKTPWFCKAATAYGRCSRGD
jgi:hypothetical protein